MLRQDTAFSKKFQDEERKLQKILEIRVRRGEAIIPEERREASSSTTDGQWLERC